MMKFEADRAVNAVKKNGANDRMGMIYSGETAASSKVDFTWKV